MTTITTQTTHPTLSPYLGDLMTQFDHATQPSNPILEKIKFADIIEATINTIEYPNMSIVHGLETGIEINIDGEIVNVDGADPMFSEVLFHISPQDVGYTRETLCRKNLHDYCRLALTNPTIEKDWGVELVERAVRIVQNIEAKEAKEA